MKTRGEEKNWHDKLVSRLSDFWKTTFVCMLKPRGEKAAHGSLLPLFQMCITLCKYFCIKQPTKDVNFSIKKNNIISSSRCTTVNLNNLKRTSNWTWKCVIANFVLRNASLESTNFQPLILYMDTFKKTKNNQFYITNYSVTRLHTWFRDYLFAPAINIISCLSFRKYTVNFL